MLSNLTKILLIHSDLLLSSGVESILTQEADLELVNVKLKNRNKLIDTFKQLRPNVIICDENTFQANEPFLCNMIDHSPEIRLFVLSVKKNDVLVFNKQNIPITESSDLLNAIRGGRHPFV